jgi:hypothetical protein
VPFNDTTQAIDCETPLFKGKVLVMMRGMANTPAVFDGKKRLMWMAIQVTGLWELQLCCCARIL